MMKKQLGYWIPALAATGLCLLCSACTSAPTAPILSAADTDPKALLHWTCSQGKTVQSIKGTVRMKAKSKDASGQFPGAVDVSPGKLRLEVTNLLGGTEAVITIDGENYKIDVPKQKDAGQKGSQTWAGIPLRWATDLFLGRLPCPAAYRDLSPSITSHGELVVEQPAALGRDAERFIYSYRLYDGKPWAETLQWERKGAFAQVVKFKFEEPESKTLSPRKWEAVSSQGEVKLKWLDRKPVTEP